MGLQVPPALANSYRGFASYPENLVNKSTYIGGLRNYRTQLDDIQNSLFHTKDANINVPFQDLEISGNGTAHPSFDLW